MMLSAVIEHGNTKYSKVVTWQVAILDDNMLMQCVVVAQYDRDCRLPSRTDRRTVRRTDGPTDRPRRSISDAHAYVTPVTSVFGVSPPG